MAQVDGIARSYSRTPVRGSGEIGSGATSVGLQKLKGQGGKYRIRIGDFRVIYTIQDEVLVVLVVEVGKRDEVY